MSETDHSELGERQLAFLNEVQEKTGWSTAQLCKAAKISPSTLSVFRSGKRPGHVLNNSTIERVERASGISMDGRQIAAPFPKAQTLNDAEPYEPAHSPTLKAAVDSLLTGFPGRSAMTLRTNNMVVAGYASGDVLVCDPSIEPNDGDLVIALSGNGETGPKRTIVRFNHHPYLVTAGADGHSRWPIVVDRWSTRITAVVIASLRGRNLS